MRKKILVLTMCACMAMTAIGCGSTADPSNATTTAAENTDGGSETSDGADNESESAAVSQEDSMADVFSNGLDDNGYISGVKAQDMASLYDYKSLTALPASDVIPSDEDVQSEIDSKLDSSAQTTQVTDREVKDGDAVNIDYTGYVDDKAFDGGSATEYTYDPNGGTPFIDGFYEQIIGHTPGDETFSITVTFPEDYSAENLKGKEARFDIVLHYIEEKTRPEFNDDFVKNTLSQDMTADEYREKVKSDLQETKSLQYFYKQILDNSKVENVPDEIIQMEKTTVDARYEMTAAYNGQTLDEYYTSQGITEDVIKQYCTEQATQKLIMQAIAEKEGIEVTDDDLNEYFSTQLDSLVQYYGKGYVASMELPVVVMKQLIKDLPIE